MKKPCFKCSLVKPLAEFYAHPRMADGHLNKCKSCTRRDVRTNRAENISHYRQYDVVRAKTPQRVAANQAYADTEAGQAWKSKTQATWRSNHPNKRHAHIAVGNAVRSGALKREPCIRCGAVAEAHHEDYSRPLQVTWLCKEHHTERHMELKKGK